MWWAEKRFRELECEALVLVNREGGILVLSRGPSAVEIAKRLAEKMEGNAGGNDRLARGGGRNTESLEGKLKEVIQAFERGAS